MQGLTAEQPYGPCYIFQSKIKFFHAIARGFLLFGVNWSRQALYRLSSWKPGSVCCRANCQAAADCVKCRYFYVWIKWRKSKTSQAGAGVINIWLDFKKKKRSDVFGSRLNGQQALLQWLNMQVFALQCKYCKIFWRTCWCRINIPDFTARYRWNERSFSVCSAQSKSKTWSNLCHNNCPLKMATR